MTDKKATTKEEYMASINTKTKSAWKWSIFEHLKAHPQGVTDRALYVATRGETDMPEDQIKHNVACQLTYLRKRAMDIEKHDGIIKLLSYWDNKENKPVTL